MFSTCSKLYVPNTEKLTSSRTKSNVRALVVVHTRLRKHGVVLDLGLTQRWRVGRNKHKLGLAATHVFKSTLQTERNLTRLHDELQLRVDVVLAGLLGLRLRSHDLEWVSGCSHYVGLRRIVAY